SEQAIASFQYLIACLGAQILLLRALDEILELDQIAAGARREIVKFQAERAGLPWLWGMGPAIAVINAAHVCQILTRTGAGINQAGFDQRVQAVLIGLKPLTLVENLPIPTQAVTF